MTQARSSEKLQTAFIVVLLLLAVVGLWEGAKAFSRAVNYALDLPWGGTLDLRNFNNQQLPHLGDIARSFVEPAQRNGPPLGLILLNASLFTLSSAVIGFVLGGVLGFLLAIIFAHSRLLQRGLLPYVVASQTIPILAIAPMVVVWMRQINLTGLAVPIIAAYLTFFPVTVYALRGLTSVSPLQLELMRSYAATRWQILFKLRIPNALPQIFTALKISATASVVGTIIGELPSGIQSGLGGAILNFNQYYVQGPPRLWATIVAASLVGMLFFGVVALAERLIVRWNRPE
ncbi:MAG: ABC transporter permease [Anaerolineae bacterium]|nr:ABC transporter permease [Anaerolineae bacterium]MDW8171771.1 ABC transporter permease [Anaerolineae bacterium]